MSALASFIINFRMLLLTGSNYIYTERKVGISRLTALLSAPFIAGDLASLNFMRRYVKRKRIKV
jgi:hypothetical protein